MSSRLREKALGFLIGISLLDNLPAVFAADAAPAAATDPALPKSVVSPE